MSGFQMPGPLCRYLGALEIDAGTMCLSTSHAPGPVGQTKRDKKNPFDAHALKHPAKPALKHVTGRSIVKSGPYLISDQSLLIKLPGSVAVIPPADAQYGVQCVGLVKVWGKSPSTSQWKQGALVRNSPTLKRGTVIATFVGGIYPSHTTIMHAFSFSFSVT